MIDVIIPVYNVEKYIERCVKSLLNQSYSDYRIILIDDDSSDSSGEICDRLAKENEKVRNINVNWLSLTLSEF